MSWHQDTIESSQGRCSAFLQVLILSLTTLSSYVALFGVECNIGRSIKNLNSISEHYLELRACYRTLQTELSLGIIFKRVRLRRRVSLGDMAMAMMNVLTEVGGLMWNHPYVSCSLLIFFTPPFFPILKFFSPLLLSTTLVVFGIATLGPHFQNHSDQEVALQISPQSIDWDENAPRKEEGEQRDANKLKSGKNRFTWGDWVKNCKESGLAWVEQKLLKNENWRGATVNDENVSILQEAFAHKVEENSRTTPTKLITMRIPENRLSEEPALERQAASEYANSDSWKPVRSVSERSSDRPPSFSGVTNSRDLPHDFFSPHPSFSRRLESDTPLFEDFVPPPIEPDMPPLITGPASITAPLLKSLEDMDSDDGFDHHDCHHDEDLHLELGEKLVDADFSSQEMSPVSPAAHDQPPAANVQGKDVVSPGDVDEPIHQESASPTLIATESSDPIMHPEVHTRDIDLHDEQSVADTSEQSVTPTNDVPKEYLPAADIRHESLTPFVALHEAQSAPTAENHQVKSPPSSAVDEESLEFNKDAELLDIPELEDILPAEKGTGEPAGVDERSIAVASDLHDAGVRHGDLPASTEEPDASVVSIKHADDSEAPPSGSQLSATSPDVFLEPSHSVERSMSLPVVGSLAATESPEDTAQESLTTLVHLLPDNVHETTLSHAALVHAISLPAVLPKDPIAQHSVDQIVIPPKTADHGPSSPDTEIGDGFTSPEHEKQGGLAARFFSAERHNSITSISGDELDGPHAQPAKQLSTKEKLSNLEVLSNSIAPAPSAETRTLPTEVLKVLQPTTEEQVSHVSDKLKGFIEDSPSKKFHPDAPQLQITPPSTKVVLSPSPSKPAIVSPSKPAIVSPARKPSIVPPSTSRKLIAQYSSSDDSSDDEQIELDSEVDADGTDSESDFEVPLPVKPGMKLKPPPKLPAKLRTPQPTVQPA